jgi:hypothetical protein
MEKNNCDKVHFSDLQDLEAKLKRWVTAIMNNKVKRKLAVTWEFNPKYEYDIFNAILKFQKRVKELHGHELNQWEITVRPLEGCPELCVMESFIYVD